MAALGGSGDLRAFSELLLGHELGESESTNDMRSASLIAADVAVGTRRVVRGDMTLTWTPAEQAAPVRSAHERTSPEGVAGRSDGLLVCRDDRIFPVDWLRRVAIERVGITPTRSMAVTASP